MHSQSYPYFCHEGRNQFSFFNCLLFSKIFVDSTIYDKNPDIPCFHSVKHRSKFGKGDRNVVRDARNKICKNEKLRWNFNLFMTVGSYLTHENWPMNWPDFAASPVRLGWPARNRHTLACTHQFSHIIKWPPKPAVWFMSEWRAVTIEHARI